MRNWTRKFWEDTKERTVSSAIQGFVNGAGLQVAGEFVDKVDVQTLPWQGALLGAAGMALLTFTKCLYASTRGDSDSASLSKDVGPAT